MRLIGKRRLDSYAKQHADVRSQVSTWVAEAEAADWKTSQDIKIRYSTASFLAGNVVVFNLKGNKYRLATRVAFKTSVVEIIDIGTHAEYENWNL